MPYTYLTADEKLRSLLYVSNNEFSSNTSIQNKQQEVIKIFLENYIQECDYHPYTQKIKHKKYGLVYTFN